jgi:hypothetical protein
MSSSIDPLAVLIALVAAVILSAFCLLAWRQQRRLAAIQTQLDNLSSAILSLEAVREGLFVRSLNLPRSRKARKSSSPLSGTLEEKMTAPTQPDEKKSTETVL